MRRFQILGIVGFALLSPGLLQAQTEIEVAPFAGAALFMSDLTDVFGTDQVVQSHGNSFAVGGHLGVHLSRLSLEATVAMVPTDVVTSSPTLGGNDATTGQTIILASANALLNFSGELFEPFIAAGAGIKKHSADDPQGGFVAGSDVTFNFGAGGRFYVTETTAIRADVRDYISTFDAFELAGSGAAKTQHDILVTVGLSFRVGS